MTSWLGLDSNPRKKVTPRCSRLARRLDTCAAATWHVPGQFDPRPPSIHKHAELLATVVPDAATIGSGAVLLNSGDSLARVGEGEALANLHTGVNEGSALLHGILPHQAVLVQRVAEVFGPLYL